MKRKSEPKLIRIKSHHAAVKEITAKGHPLKGKIMRRPKHGSKDKTDFKYQLAQTLANLIFPKLFPEIVAVGRSGKRVYSNKVELTKASQHGIEDYYKKGERTSATLMHENKVHNSFELSKLAADLRNKGIVVQKNPGNVGFRKKGGKPVFFEVWEMNINLLEETINKEKISKLKRKQALEVLDALKRAVPEEKHGHFARVHIVPRTWN